METLNRTVLIVDDEVDLLEILCLSFESKGYNVLSASSGNAAFEIIRSNQVDLVISDIRMPDGDGVELLNKVNNFNFEVPIVLFMTGFSDLSLADAYDKGAEAVFAKPFDQSNLLKVVEKALAPKETRWRRVSEREECDILIQLKFDGFQEARNARLMNLGRGGFFVALEEPFPTVDNLVSFQFDFADEVTTRIQGTGIVRWVRETMTNELPPGCGVEFTKLDESIRLRVLELINFVKTRQYIPKV